MSRLNRISPYFLVDDVEESANYYRDTLGFHYYRLWGEPPGFVIVSRDGVEIMLRRPDTPGAGRSNAAVAEDAWDAYIRVENADSLHAEFAAKGANIIRALEDTEYAMREFEVRDTNGYVPCFAHPIG